MQFVDVDEPLPGIAAMFTLQIPGWQIVVRTVVVYLALSVGLRLMGKRELEQMIKPAPLPSGGHVTVSTRTIHFAAVPREGKIVGTGSIPEHPREGMRYEPSRLTRDEVARGRDRTGSASPGVNRPRA
jgi:hypothetical protein